MVSPANIVQLPVVNNVSAVSVAMLLFTESDTFVLVVVPSVLTLFTTRPVTVGRVTWLYFTNAVSTNALREAGTVYVNRVVTACGPETTLEDFLPDNDDRS